MKVSCRDSYLYAVVSHYSILYILELNDQPKSVIQPNMKERICWNILTSGTFDGKAEPLAMDTWLRYWKLKFKYPKAMNLLTDKKRKLFSRPQLTYPDQSIEVHINNSLNATRHEQLLMENAFICLARDRRTKKKNLLDFYISDEYNVNVEVSHNYVAGRFIFVKERPHSENKIVLYLAEEPATVIEHSVEELESLYLTARQKRKSRA